MAERWNIVYPLYPTQRYPYKPNPSPFSKRTTPTKRSQTESKRGSEKHCKSRKVEERHFIPTKTEMPTFSLSPALVAITLQVTTTATGPLQSHQQCRPNSEPEQSETATKLPNFCHLCTPVGRICLNNYTFQNLLEWSDPKQVEDWKGEREKEKEHKKKESKEKKKELNSLQKELKQRP